MCWASVGPFVGLVWGKLLNLLITERGRKTGNEWENYSMVSRCVIGVEDRIIRILFISVSRLQWSLR
jgi:hypothetical protein